MAVMTPNTTTMTIILLRVDVFVGWGFEARVKRCIFGVRGVAFSFPRGGHF
jgi:hypothetical protein